MRKVAKASAPGKIHLIGEHSSVYGKPAVLVAINRRITVSLKNANTNSFGGDKKVLTATKAIQNFITKKYMVELQPVSVSIQSDLPIGQGMGSSAAFSAALTGALFWLYKLPFETDSIFEAAYEGEKIFHGNPSGGDLAASVYGGVVWFRKETENIKIIKKLNISKKSPTSFFIIDSGKAIESTKEMVVDIVGRKFKKDIKAVGSIMDAQEIITKDLANALVIGDNKMLEFAIVVAEENLEKLGVVGLKTKKIIKTLEKAGISVKISGAGGVKEGSGILVCLPKNVFKIKRICKENNWDFFSVDIEQEGIRIEK